MTSLRQKRNNMKKIIILLIVLFLLGAGCTSSQQTPVKNTVASSTLIIKKPVVEETPVTSYDYCENHSYEIIVRFDDETQASKAFCRFADTTECETDAFQKGTCLPGKGSKAYHPEEQIQIYENCTQKYEPVCGENGTTFTNECLARMQKIKIIRSGACPPAQKNATQTSSATQQKTDTTNTSLTTSALPDWIELAIDMITSQPPASPRAFIEKCSYSGNTVYYQSTSCPNCQTTLNNEKGQILCYPNNDFKGTCPSYFRLNTKKDFCKLIWSDKR